ncbi:MAG: N-6 DNA methylase [Streptococcaceae bacterium]|jgi:type I restriction-modification system DNA methylase subunit|nr:N-6 DNA methylase [Streptococcaceae bacterium]
MLDWNIIKGRLLNFSKDWRDFKGLESQKDQQFITDFLSCFGVIAGEVGVFQERVGHDRMDYLWSGMLGIEMKSPGKSLAEVKKQLYKYYAKLPSESAPKYLIVSDFETIKLQYMLTKQEFHIKVSELYKNIHRFAEIAGFTSETAYEDQIEVNLQATEKMAKLHDALKSHGYDGHALEVYLVRLLFCLFAEDTGIFPKNKFRAYIEKSKVDGSDLSARISKLFEVLNLSKKERDKRTLLDDELKCFQYINGSLFLDTLPSAEFNKKMRQILLDCVYFDWSKISPAIFGAMFQGVMSPQQRREMGAHYTSEENILKLIGPLFLDELRAEFERIKLDPVALRYFHEKISKMKFLDPACGCGNFLIITYRELRKLELDVIKILFWKTPEVNLHVWLKLNVGQFYGIELEDFPCQIAQVGMWLVDHQMNLLVSVHFGKSYVRLPFTLGVNIVQGNALHIDWESVVPKSDLSYILGNPPFNGSRTMSAEQKEDMKLIFDDLKGLGNLDYVTAWYKKASDYIFGTQIQCAFVSTNSITQGEQPAILWKSLMERGVYINFGIRSFKWSNEAKGKAAVFVVIIGFSYIKTEPYINQYLLEAPTVFIESRQHPICDVPVLGIGNQPIDGGHFLFTENEMREFICKEPLSEKFFRKWMGADEFINGHFRYYLFLRNCLPNELRRMPECLKRISAVRLFRSNSKRNGTRAIADVPLRFLVENLPESEYFVIPEISSETRQYVPIGFMSSDVLASNRVKIARDAKLYHFGILTSSVHMAWVRVICGRFEMRYCYSVNIVYNNFPWPVATDKQRNEIEKYAQGILDVRARFPDSSLADLYDPLTMPSELLNAHKALDRAVAKLYGLSVKDMEDEEVCVAKLLVMYQNLAG